MEALKLIPQAFFEFFARLVPGLIAFSLWLTVLGGAAGWRSFMEALLGPSQPNSTSANQTVWVVVAAIAACYVLGQLVAPFGKMLQMVVEGIAKRTRWKLPDKGDAYDYLRANKPDLGALAGKIRAEYTMFYASAAVFIVTGTLKAGSLLNLSRPDVILGGLALLGMACLWRGFEVSKTFIKTSKKLKDGLAGAQSVETTQEAA
jgi:hypothetical protein